MEFLSLRGGGRSGNRGLQVKTLIVILTVLVSPIMTIVTMIGVVDLYTSLRKVIIMKDGEKK